jgi:uncharacterized membrane protein
MTLIAAGILLAAVIIAIAPRPTTSPSGEAVSFAQMKQIISTRCTVCHSQAPTQAGFASAPLGVMFDTDEQILSQAVQIYQQSVLSKTMPIANLTSMTDVERDQINRWYNAGAKP